MGPATVKPAAQHHRWMRADRERAAAATAAAATECIINARARRAQL